MGYQVSRRRSCDCAFKSVFASGQLGWYATITGTLNEEKQSTLTAWRPAQSTITPPSRQCAHTHSWPCLDHRRSQGCGCAPKYRKTSKHIDIRSCCILAGSCQAWVRTSKTHSSPNTLTHACETRWEESHSLAGAHHTSPGPPTIVGCESRGLWHSGGSLYFPHGRWALGLFKEEDEPLIKCGPVWLTTRRRARKKQLGFRFGWEYPAGRPWNGTHQLIRLRV